MKPTFSTKLFLLLALFPFSLLAQTATKPAGDGSSGNPYQIATVENLYWLTQSDSVWDEGKYFIQTANIDASSSLSWDGGQGFTSIGRPQSDSFFNPINFFNGTYDGNGHTISGLFLSRSSNTYQGMFGYSIGGVVKNLTLQNVDVYCKQGCGGLIGVGKETSVENVHVSGKVTGGTSIYNNQKVRIGGIAGDLKDTSLVANSSVSELVVSGDNNVGGIAGRLDYNSKITNSYASNTVRVNAQAWFGGLAGVVINEGTTIEDSYSMASVIARNIDRANSAGGIAGYLVNSATINRCYFKGIVTAETKAGGIVGESRSSAEIKNSFSSGFVTGEDYGDPDDTKWIGGLVGFNQNSSTVVNSYSTSFISADDLFGGVIGYNTNATVTNSYYLSMDGSLPGLGYDDNSQSATNLSITNMKKQSSFSGWDFTDTWGISEDETFPFLQQTPFRVSEISISGNEGWRMYGFPFKGATFKNSIDDLWTQGFAGSDQNSGTANVLLWDQENQSWSTPDSLGDSLSVGQGFITYVFEDTDPSEAGVQNGFPKSFLLNGNTYELPQTLDLSYSNGSNSSLDGFNLISNPSASTIDWDGVSLTNTSNTYYVWDPENSHYDTYQAGVGGTNGGTNLIAPFQGFWVKATGPSANVTVDSADISSTGGALYKSNSEIISLVLNVENESGKKDQLRLVVRDDSEPNRDAYDAIKLNSLSSSYVSLSSRQGERSLVIDSRPQSQSMIFDLLFEGMGTDEHGLLSIHEHTLPESWEVVLINTQTDERFHLLEKPAEVTFEMIQAKNANALNSPLTKTTNKETVWQLHLLTTQATDIEPETVPQKFELSQNYPNPFNPTTKIEFAVPQSTQVTLEVFDMLGRKVVTLINRETKQAGRYSLQFDAGNLTSGLYLYRLKAGNTVITKKLTLIK